jgi:hypothetical protein
MGFMPCPKAVRTATAHCSGSDKILAEAPEIRNQLLQK